MWSLYFPAGVSYITTVSLIPTFRVYVFEFGIYVLEIWCLTALRTKALLSYSLSSPLWPPAAFSPLALLLLAALAELDRHPCAVDG